MIKTRSLKKITKNIMRWTRVILINVLVLLLLFVLLEFGAGLARVLIGKRFLTPKAPAIISSIDFPAHSSLPCNEMKTDVLLNHVPNHNDRCVIKDGYAIGEYVHYNISRKSDPVLLTLGGSTTSGFYQHFSDGETYPKQLADLAIGKYKIMNGGVGAYSSLQDLYKFLRDGPRISNLEIVVSLGGINELPNYHGDDTLRTLEFPFLTSTQFRMNKQQKWVDQRVALRLGMGRWFSYFPNLRSLYLRFSGYSVDPTDDLKDDKETKELERYRLNNKIFSKIGSVDRWEENVRRLNALVELKGAKFYYFLQPTMGLLGPQSKPKLGSSDERLYSEIEDAYLNEIRELYSSLKRRCSDLKVCYDISDDVPPDGSVYKDPRHHNAVGNYLLADVIWTIVSEQAKSQFR